MVVRPPFLRESTTVSSPAYSTPRTDQLSELLDLIEVRGVLTGGFAVDGPWVTGGAMDHPLKLLVLGRGRARISTDGIDAPVDLGAGDVVVLNQRAWMELGSPDGDGPRQEVVPDPGFPSTSLLGPGGAADRDATGEVVLGGRVDLDPAGRAVLSRALPPLGHVRASTSAPLRGLLDRLLDEVAHDRPGSSAAVRQYGQLLLLEVLRAQLVQDELPPGWLRAQADDRLRPALALLHAEPDRAWTLDQLARAAAMSRTSFAERFRDTTGTPALTYLRQWRMLLARRALRERDVPLSTLATEVGYASESAFSTAFRRETGESPLQHRRRVRAGARVPA